VGQPCRRMPPADRPTEPSSEPAEPEFGPTGYLPERAARRARKIILREPLGLQWAIAAVVTGLVVAGAGAVFLLGLPGEPGEGEEPLVPLGAVERGEVLRETVAGQEVLLVPVSGGLRAFAAPETTVVWCEASQRLEGTDGRVWDLDGARQGGSGASLARLPVTVHDEVVHVEPGEATAPAPSGQDREPACVD